MTNSALINKALLTSFQEKCEKAFFDKVDEISEILAIRLAGKKSQIPYKILRDEGPNAYRGDELVDCEILSASYEPDENVFLQGYIFLTIKYKSLHNGHEVNTKISSLKVDRYFRIFESLSSADF